MRGIAPTFGLARQTLAGFSGTYLLKSGEGPGQILVEKSSLPDEQDSEYILNIDGYRIQGHYEEATKTFSALGCYEGGYTRVILAFQNGAFHLSAERGPNGKCEPETDESGMIDQTGMAT
jgi:hypothetical protein